MKPFAIILIILVLAAVVGIGWLYFSVREATVTWYFWGIPFSSKITLGQ